jgi:mannose-1-phosphate guanylyltransferase
MRIARLDPEAIVAIFPCDHHYSPESAFTATLESAFAVAEQHAHSVVLLGAEPKGPEVEYGWIETGEAVLGRAGLFRVKNFHEKPPLAMAQYLFRAARFGTRSSWSGTCTLSWKWHGILSRNCSKRSSRKT